MNAEIDPMVVPCGKCELCLKARAREWTTRLLHELSYYDSSMFVTLTYNDENLPIDGSLSKRALRLFIKRFRKRISPRRIKYYGCGEYGEESFRPHYHLIMFGVKKGDFVPTGSKFYAHEDWINLKSRESLGNIYLGSVTNASIRYVANYISKKSLKPNCTVEAPFQVQSQGIGERFAKDNEKQIKDNLGITVNGVNTGIPRYYKKKLKIETDELYSKSVEAMDELIEKLDKKFRGKEKDNYFYYILKLKFQQIRSMKVLENMYGKREIKVLKSLDEKLTTTKST